MVKETSRIKVGRVNQCSLYLNTRKKGPRNKPTARGSWNNLDVSRIESLARFRTGLTELTVPSEGVELWGHDRSNGRGHSIGPLLMGLAGSREVKESWVSFVHPTYWGGSQHYWLEKCLSFFLKCITSHLGSAGCGGRVEYDSDLENLALASVLYSE